MYGQQSMSIAKQGNKVFDHWWNMLAYQIPYCKDFNLVMLLISLSHLSSCSDCIWANSVFTIQRSCTSSWSDEKNDIPGQVAQPIGELLVPEIPWQVRTLTTPLKQSVLKFNGW